MKPIPLALLGTLLSISGAAWPLTSELTLRQLNHRPFTSAQGAPSNILALAQTSDGTLWIGSGSGLTRFDGVSFVSYPRASEEPLPDISITALLASPDGGLWIGFGSGGTSYLEAGRLVHYRPEDGAPDDAVYQLAWDRDGSLWAATLKGLSHFKDNRWTRIPAQEEHGTVVGVLVDRGGTLWMPTTSGLFARDDGSAGFRKVDDRTFDYWTQGTILASAPDGAVWVSTPKELLRIDRSQDSSRESVVTVRGIAARGPLFVDSGGNLWGADTEPGILARVPFRQLIAEGRREITVRPEKFSRTDGLTGTGVYAVLEDRERNIWIGTSLGLERFSYGNVQRESAACEYGAIAAGDAGTLWMACYSPASTTAEVREIRDGTIVSRQATPALTAAYRDPDGTVWFGGEAVLGHLEKGRLTTVPLPEPLRGRFVQSLVRDARGAMWVSVYGNDIVRFQDGVWSTRGNLEGLPPGHAVAASADEAGVLWFAFVDHGIARVDGDHVQIFPARDGLAIGKLLSVLAEDGQVWVGGNHGLTRLAGQRFVPVLSSTSVPFKGISGIVRARNGDLWLNGMNGIARIPRHEVERLLREPAHRVASETFDQLDGVPGPAYLYGAQPTAVLTSDGRAWFLMADGIVSIDANRLVRNTLVPPVTIWSLSSGSTRYPVRNAELRLPLRTNNVQIEYTAGSLTVPERIHFRYQLEGSDSDWQDAGTRREAVYTNLGPGRYTFRVTASNNDGIWNDAGATLQFTIPPAFYQTTWFYLLAALAGVALLAALYRVRVRHVAAQVRSRLEARLAERERIARELHDTLLQGMQGLIWRFQAAADRIPPGEPARQLLEQSLDRADKLLGESRDKVKDLRPVASDVPDLAQVLAAEGAELAQAHPVAFRVSEQGARRDLHPIVREEAVLIGREALGNAFRHSGASSIEVELTYGDAALHFRIRDDGKGIAAHVLDAGGRPGHFGLVGMRERAKKLGAHLQIWTKPGAGTEVDIRVPADVAYRRSNEDRDDTRSWLARLRST